MKKLLLISALAAAAFAPAKAAETDGVYVLTDRQDRSAWTISGCSQEPASAGDNSDGDLTRIIDDNTDTYWHSSWHTGHPSTHHYFVIDRGEDATETIYGFGYVPRQSGNQGNGYVTKCDVYVLNDISGLLTMDGEQGGVVSDKAEELFLQFIADKTPNGHGNFNYTYNNTDNRGESKVVLSNPANGRYVLFVATETHGIDGGYNNKFANCAEFYTYDGFQIPCNQVFRMMMRANGTANSYVYWDGRRALTRENENADAFVPERLWYLKNAGDNKVTLHTIAESGEFGLAFEPVTNTFGSLSSTPTELTPTLNVYTLASQNADCAVTNFALQISGNAYVNDAKDSTDSDKAVLGVWNNGFAATDDGSLITFYALTDADIDSTDATETAKAAAKADKTPKNISALFDLTAKSKEELAEVISQAASAISEKFRNDLPGYLPTAGELYKNLTEAKNAAQALVDKEDATLQELGDAKSTLMQFIFDSNTFYQGPFYGIYTINNQNSNRGYLCYVENDNNYAIASSKSGYTIPELDSDASKWAFVTVNGQQLLFNVASKKFLKPTGTGANDAWLLLDEDPAPISIAQSSFGQGKVEINSTFDGTIHHMSISNGFVGGVTGYYASNDAGVPFEFTRVADLSDELREEMENILITRLTNPDRVYTITNADVANDRGSLIAVEDHNLIYTTHKGEVALDATNPNHQWSFVTIDNKLYLYNIGAAKFANAYLTKKAEGAGSGSFDWSWQLCDAGTPVTIKYYTEGNLKTYRIMGGENTAGDDVAGMMVINNNYAPVPTWSHGTDGNGFTFSQVADAAAMDADMTAKHNQAITADGIAAQIINTDDLQNEDLVGSYTATAVSNYGNAINGASDETDPAKQHGIYAAAAHYLNAAERVMPQNGSVYTIYDVNAGSYVYPDPKDKSEASIGWLYTATDNGATFTHTFVPSAAQTAPATSAAPYVEPVLFDGETVVTLHDNAVSIKMAPTVGQVYLTKEGSDFGPYAITRSDLSHSTTEIAEINAGDKVGEIFDLQGRRLAAPVHGVNIINGKKVLVK